uniref:phospholipase A2 n=1 Tax=Xiphophorus couchianus TaxID=32473 RepID=A0A3B5MIZ1_9TELE
ITTVMQQKLKFLICFTTCFSHEPPLSDRWLSAGHHRQRREAEALVRVFEEQGQEDRALAHLSERESHCQNETWDQELVKKFNISLLLFPDAPCALVVPTPELTGRRTDETERKTRRKRSWIFPGTLWCGTGSKAAGYEQLGMFERADKCCREHDHCSDIIPAFTVNYGVFNPNFFTVSHCECDQRFRQCLLGMNDSISSMVGYSFFNILKVPCFELKQLKHCTQMYWWGMKASQSKHRCGLRDLPRGDTFHRRRTKGNGCKRQEKLSGEGPSQKPKTVKKVHISKRKRGEKMKKRRKDFSGLAQKSNIPSAIPTTTSTQISPKLLCQSLKHLDDCKFKIPPLEKKYNLTNMESKTAYHCDCTSRLAVQIKSVKKPSPPHSLLRDFVSQDCFTLPKENKCNRTKRYQTLKCLSELSCLKPTHRLSVQLVIRLISLVDVFFMFPF